MFSSICSHFTNSLGKKIKRGGLCHKNGSKQSIFHRKRFNIIAINIILCGNMKPTSIRFFVNYKNNKIGSIGEDSLMYETLNLM